MKRMKPILPTLREKKRYLAFEILSENKINDPKKVSEAIWESSLDFLGTDGASQAGIWVLPDKYKNQKGILKVGHRYVEKLRTCLALIKTIGKKPVVVRTIGISGILKKTEKKFITG
ncbi:Rpp14/Pop5 family protein [Nanoarchaeota archaeon]